MKIHDTSSISDRIVEQLLEMIRKNELKSGDRLLSEREMMNNFGVSRLACREALAKLQGMGVLKARHGKGVFLTDIRSMSVNPEVLQLLQVYGDISNADVLQARLIIEPPSASYAAKNAGPGEKKQIKEITNKVEQSLEGLGPLEKAKRFAEEDVNFHQAVAAASGNPVLPMLLKSMHELLYRIRFEVLILKPDVMIRGMADHRKIAKAIYTGDSKAAEEAMERHIRLRGAELLKDELSLYPAL
jgi:GntR family transcriptional repressor for pyruvate dehydrogenase complex